MQMKKIKKTIKNPIFIIIILIFLVIFNNKFDIISNIFYENKSISTISKNEKTNNFINIYYYKEENQKRYEEYKKNNPELSEDNIVWMVNANIDYGFYNKVEQIIHRKQTLILVNKNHKLPDDFVPENLVKLDSGHYLTKDTKIAFEKMKKDALNQGYKLGMASAYRSIESQKNLYNNYLKIDLQNVVDTYSARPGFSEHHTGEAIDIVGSFGSIEEFEQTKESKWIEDNAYKYGFIIRYKKGYEDITGYKSEPWHIRYVGIYIAKDMNDKKVNTLEEYYEKYISY